MTKAGEVLASGTDGVRSTTQHLPRRKCGRAEQHVSKILVQGKGYLNICVGCYLCHPSKDRGHSGGGEALLTVLCPQTAHVWFAGCTFARL